MKAAQGAMKTRNILQSQGKLTEFARGTVAATSAALADFAVVNPDDAATIALSPAATPFIWAFKKIRPRVANTKAWAFAQQHVQEVFGDKSDIILKEIEGVSPKTLDDTLDITPGVQPTAGQLSPAPEVQAIERASRKGGRALEFEIRDQENKEAVARSISEAFADQPGEAAAARRIFEGQAADEVTDTVRALDEAGLQLSAVEAEADALRVAQGQE